VRRWETQILAWHRTAGASNGRTEAVNLLIKKIPVLSLPHRKRATALLWSRAGEVDSKKISTPVVV
jgi:hypothetical protein